MAAKRRPIVLTPGGGRDYPMRRIRAIFKADGDETAQGYSISEWWLEPHTQGPGPHAHPEDDVFFVIAGTMSILVGTEWIDAPVGSFVLVPGGLSAVACSCRCSVHTTSVRRTPIRSNRNPA